MKKLIFVFVALIGISTLAYAGSMHDWSGADRFLTNLNLDEARQYEVEKILKGYMQVKDLAMSGRQDEIPAFVEAQNVQLQMVLTDVEYQQFKENVGQWAKGKDFSKFKMFSGQWGG